MPKNQTINKELIDIRCPFSPMFRKVGGKLYKYNKPCNNLCAKVYPGSSGEGYCNSCKLTFDYSVDDQSIYKNSIRVKQV